MFDDKQLAAYRHISAPASLKEKVLSSCTEERSSVKDPKKIFRMVSSLAACLILVICFSVMAIGNLGETGVSVSGRTLDAGETRTVSYGISPMGLSEARTLSYVDVPVSLALERDSEITVSDGIFYVLDGENNEISATVLSGTVYQTDTDTALIWTVSADAERKTFEMTVKSLFDKEIITLTYEETTGEWVVSRSK